MEYIPPEAFLTGFTIELTGGVGGGGVEKIKNNFKVLPTQQSW